jgi:hypothetical protein
MLEQHERVWLRRFLSERFSLDELRILAFDLSVSPDSLSHSSKDSFCIELITYFERRNNLSCLILEVLRVRDHDFLHELLSRLTDCSPRRKVRIILEDVSPTKRAELIEAIVRIYNVLPDDIALVASAPGSLRLLVGLPSTIDDHSTSRAFHEADNDYRIRNITPFETLEELEQYGWRLVVQKVLPPLLVPPIRSDRAQSADQAETADLLVRRGLLAWQQGELTDAFLFYLESLLAISHFRAEREVVRSLDQLERIARREKNVAAIERIQIGRVQLLRPRAVGEAVSESQLTSIMAPQRLGLAELEQLYTEALIVSEQHGYLEDIVAILHVVALIAQFRGDYLRASRLYHESLTYPQRPQEPLADAALQILARLDLSRP